LASCPPIVAHWRIPIGCCVGRPILFIQGQLININKLVSCKEQLNMRIDFMKQNENFEKSQE
jgi:hypothetical protein